LSAELQFGQCSSSSAGGLELEQLEGRGSACSVAALQRVARLFRLWQQLNQHVLELELQLASVGT
jgi:hypothetical protein